jgi:stress-induced morphogen
MVDAATVQAALEAGLINTTSVSVIDVSGGCGSAFEVALIWPGFAGKTRLARHRAVTGALAEMMPSIHALSIKKTATPEEAEVAAAARNAR